MRRGRVLVNEQQVRASYQVKPGDIIEINMGTRAVRVEVLSVQENVGKNDAPLLYRLLR